MASLLRETKDPRYKDQVKKFFKNQHEKKLEQEVEQFKVTNKTLEQKLTMEKEIKVKNTKMAENSFPKMNR